MIVVKRKPINEIRQNLEKHKNILALGCGTCATVSIEGGEKEARELAGLLNLKFMKDRKDAKLKSDHGARLCDPEFVRELRRKFREIDAVLSLGCGAGIQVVSDVFEGIPVYPGVNTAFFGSNDRLGEFAEKCLACGDCILDRTGGICPITRCSKNILNGPCGGSSKGKCEISKDVDCAWQLIYDRLKLLGRVNELETIFKIKDWRTSRDGGPRKFKREESMF